MHEPIRNMEDTSPQSLDSPGEVRSPNQAARMRNDISRVLAAAFRNFPGHFSIRLWDGTSLLLGENAAGHAQPDFTIVFEQPNAALSLILNRDPLSLIESYFKENIHIEGDLFSALSLKDHIYQLRISWRDRLGIFFALMRLRLDQPPPQSPKSGSVRYDNLVKTHSRIENRDAVQFHYDVSNRFYALWLDRAMVYSCAYFEHDDDDLDVAQTAKLDYICRKLDLSPGETYLDIGCGWGALVIHAARHYGVRAHGITLSQTQLELAEKRITDAGLRGRVTVELRDYRDLPGESVYDKISSVGMIEHVGLTNIPAYFKTVTSLLKPAGLFLNHGISNDIEGWEKTLSTEFINRYVFPDGQVDTISNTQRGMEKAGLEIIDVEALRPHYALTLRHWVSRLEANHEAALNYVSESTYRVWRLYMAACALEFEAGSVGVYQILSRRRSLQDARTRLTRRHLYTASLPTAAPDL